MCKPRWGLLIFQKQNNHLPPHPLTVSTVYQTQGSISQNTPSLKLCAFNPHHLRSRQSPCSSSSLEEAGRQAAVWSIQRHIPDSRLSYRLCDVDWRHFSLKKTGDKKLWENINDPCIAAGEACSSRGAKTSSPRRRVWP